MVDLVPLDVAVSEEYSESRGLRRLGTGGRVLIGCKLA